MEIKESKQGGGRGEGEHPHQPRTGGGGQRRRLVRGRDGEKSEPRRRYWGQTSTRASEACRRGKRFGHRGRRVGGEVRQEGPFARGFASGLVRSWERRSRSSWRGQLPVWCRRQLGGIVTNLGGVFFFFSYIMRSLFLGTRSFVQH